MTPNLDFKVKIALWLQWQTDRKSRMICLLIALSVTLNDTELQDRPLFSVDYLGNDIT